jgi:hypothetical protein
MRYFGSIRFLSLFAFITVSPLYLSAQTAAGNVNIALRESSNLDTFTNSPSSSTINWFNQKIAHMQSYSPYFDTRTTWYPNAWVYFDLFALYTGWNLDSSWYLKDQSGNKLYIPWGCSGGTCPQYAADFGNQAFRSAWINQLKTLQADGYKGVWIDDVDLLFRVGDGNGNFVTPWDPRTNAPMTFTNWQLYMVQFLQQIRAAVPNMQIVHNSIWYAGALGASTTYVNQEIQAADFINLERGVSDSGLTGGNGTWSVYQFYMFINNIHALGRNVVLDEYYRNGEYGLAGYFLISNGTDALGDQTITPNNFWSGYNVKLGAPAGPFYIWNNMGRRDFADGFVLLNPPGNPTFTMSLGSSYYVVGGYAAGTIGLGAGQGIVVTTSPSAWQ